LGESTRVKTHKIIEGYAKLKEQYLEKTKELEEK